MGQHSGHADKVSLAMHRRYDEEGVGVAGVAGETQATAQLGLSSVYKHACRPPLHSIFKSPNSYNFASAIRLVLISSIHKPLPSIRIMLFLALPVLACIGFTSLGVASGSLAALWQSVFGIGPIFSLLQSATTGGVYAATIVSTSTSTMLGGLLYGIKSVVMPPPKKLKWWETEEFDVVVGLLLMLLAMWGLKCFLYRRWF
ncbi:hypothetical protein KCU78_g5633, partial [Aureobasidium melanogenum]